MTDGHKHWAIRVKRDSRVLRFLTKPRWLTRDRKKVDKSPYPYGVLYPYLTDEQGPWYYLSLLSILHRWVGLELEVPRS